MLSVGERGLVTSSSIKKESTSSLKSVSLDTVVTKISGNKTLGLGVSPELGTMQLDFFIAKSTSRSTLVLSDDEGLD